MVTRKVKSGNRAERMVAIADTMLVPATIHITGGHWFVVQFDCSDYQWIFLNRRLRKELKPQKK